ncbi:MAG: DUF167 domain-containing protein [Candidatus Margulisiibacteriota bacterium]
MRLNLRVIPNAKQNKIIEENGRYKVYLTAPAIEGRANAALIDFLAEHFKVKRRQVKIIHGEKSRDKLIEILLK